MSVRDNSLAYILNFFLIRVKIFQKQCIKLRSCILIKSGKYLLILINFTLCGICVFKNIEVYTFVCFPLLSQFK